jgi:hypothetical protein
MRNIHIRKQCIFTALLLIIIAGCEQPVDLHLKSNDKEYSVDALITDQPGSHRVKITITGAYSIYGVGSNPTVEGATVSISDNTGNIEILSQTGPGEYKTRPDFHGVPGRFYILSIQTLNGDVLMSNPEIMPEVPPIKSSYVEFVKESDLNEEGHKVFIIFDDPKGIANYYKWKWEGIYQFSTFLNRPPGSTTCWRYETKYVYLNILDDKYFDGNEKSQEITLIPYFSGTPYLVTVYQQALSKEAFEYWKLIDAQIESSGGIFDAPPSRIRGNLYCSNDPSKNVLGYFGASGMTKLPIMINRSANGHVKNFRTYPRNVNCWILPNSVRLDPDPSTWPEGWH